MSTKPDEQEKEEEEKEVDEINFIVATVGNTPTGLSDPTEKGKSITNLIEALQSVDPNSKDAEANKTSISDNNGGRIDLDENLDSPDVIKK